MTAQVAGWFLVVVAAGLSLLSLLEDANGKVEILLWSGAVALIAWVVLLRPSVQLRQDGVHIHNLVRDVHLPWPQVDVLESRWNLKVFTPDDDGYSAWAISAQRPRASAPEGSKASLLGPMAGLGRIAGGANADEVVRRERRGSAGDLAQQIRLQREEYDKAVGEGLLEPQTGPVVVRPAVLAIAALVAAVAMAAVAVLT
ncbi:hypothetical protein VV01_12780 [Luteipulveratus halotolerans]|uniref:PH domain-containing protein n=2 Tax=Luteipulveratus halotolerans TaxID=1631356 RepID=A0A0L6CJY6_9MICO|nr:hypothetical protein VV01_12780 [Luteipulveratus halotolerans]